jgi:hypothetical protein
LINFINVHGATDLPPPAPLDPPPYVDVNGDGKVGPQDVLVAINYLNALSAGEGEGLAAEGDEDKMRDGSSDRSLAALVDDVFADEAGW